ncbi:MAG: alpha/beta fold hydrolase [Anaerolineales bacterium]|nr:alpha/beta fold hydrolase [Anaerolineales bacterium]
MNVQLQRDMLDLGDGSIFRYAVMCPERESAQRKPLIIVLHPGWAGELPSPNYGEQFLASLFAPALLTTGAYIVAPDCPSPAWNHPRSVNAISVLLDYFLEEHAISGGAVSLVGYSAGGWGAWYLLQQNPGRFSSSVMIATLPIMDPVERFEDNFAVLSDVLNERKNEWLYRVPDVPLFIIHSRDDEIFPIEMADNAYMALKDDQRDVAYRTVEGVGHFHGAGYVDALKEAAPWLLKVWAT